VDPSSRDLVAPEAFFSDGHAGANDEAERF
jgi:hypothetical protein